MIVDMKQARDANTVSSWRESIWRVFVDGKLFISDDHKTTFDSDEEARRAFFDSFLWRKTSEYVAYSQKFFDKVDDPGWREEFEDKVLKNFNVKLKEYKCDDAGINI
jgi:hypothetical protein